VKLRDVVRILPYDATTLVENVIDPCHVQVAHHGTGEGSRAMTVPPKFRMVPADDDMDGGATGWASTHEDTFGEGHYVALDVDQKRVWAEAASADGGRGVNADAVAAPFASHFFFSAEQTQPRLRITFWSPFSVIYQLRSVSPPAPDGTSSRGVCLCLWITGVPSRPGETRLVIAMALPPRTGWAGLVARHQARFLSHWRVNLVLDGENALLAGQEARVAAAGGWQKAYHLAAGEADTLVLRYRRWLNAVAAGMPWAPASVSPAAGARDPGVVLGLGGRPLSAADALLDRYSTHVRDCAVRRVALSRFLAARVAEVVVGATAAVVTVGGVVAPAVVPVAATGGAAALSLAAAAGAMGLNSAIERFGTSDRAKRLPHKFYDGRGGACSVVVCTGLWVETSMTDVLFCSAGDSVSTLWPTLERRHLVREVEVNGTAGENRGTLSSSPHGHVMAVLFTPRAAAVTTSTPPPSQADERIHARGHVPARVGFGTFAPPFAFAAVGLSPHGSDDVCSRRRTTDAPRSPISVGASADLQPPQKEGAERNGRGQPPLLVRRRSWHGQGAGSGGGVETIQEIAERNEQPQSVSPQTDGKGQRHGTKQ